MPRSFALVSATMMLLCTWSAAAGQAPDSSAHVKSARQLDMVARLKLHAGVPQHVSLAPGVMVVVRRAGDFSWMQGPVLDTEAGLAAGKVRLGYGRTAYGPGYTAQAAVLRAWGNTWSEPARTWLGGEFHVTTFILDAGIGLYGSTGSVRKTRMAASFGIGF